MSRRERREAEKSGALPTADVSSASPNVRVEPERPSTTQGTPIATTELPNVSPGAMPLSRRELRELERRGGAVPVTESTLSDAQQGTSTTSEVTQGIQEPAIVLPEVAFSSQARVVEKPSFTDPIYASEPSTNSIVLDRIPDAVGVPIDVTGEIITTGSIAILTEPVDTVLTGPLDDSALDSISANDAVTGAITIVEPVSALEVIKNRPNQSVLPERSLRTGWWKPVLLAVATLAMVAAAIAAAFVIISTLGL